MRAAHWKHSVFTIAPDKQGYWENILLLHENICCGFSLEVLSGAVYTLTDEAPDPNSPIKMKV